MFADAEKVVLVCDNLNTHKAACLYEAFPPEQARRIAQKLEWHYTPKHGSWLNMAEIELSVLQRQCLNRRIESAEEMADEAQAWQDDRNEREVGVNWRFSTADARIKLSKLYPRFNRGGPLEDRSEQRREPNRPWVSDRCAEHRDTNSTRCPDGPGIDAPERSDLWRSHGNCAASGRRLR